MKLRRIIITLLLAAASLPLHAQRKVSADVQIKSVAGGKVATVTKSVYCTGNGRLVTYFRSPRAYYMVTNTKGEMQAYYPNSNEVMTKTDPDLSSSTDLLWLFLSGRIDDLGLGAYGYKQASSTREDGLIKKKFTAADPSRPAVEIVYEDYLPIYCAYTDAGGKLLSKKYLSDYKRFGRLTMPMRMTDINYGEGKDSSVVRTLYSSVKVDVDDPAFSFQVPADATPMKLPEASR